MIEAIKQDIPKSPLSSSTGQESLAAHSSYCLDSFAHPELLELASAWEVKEKEDKEREREKEIEKGEKREHETPQSSSKRARREEGGDGNSLEGKDDDEDGEIKRGKIN